MNVVLRAFPGATIVCVGSGPSLTQADVDACRGKAVVLAIKDAVRLAPWAEVFYSADDRWWKHRGHELGPNLFPGGQLRFGLHHDGEPYGAITLGIGQQTGLSTDPARLNTGNHSGYSAINLAVLLGARRIVLLGYDCHANGGRTHFFGEHTYTHGNHGFDWWRSFYPSLLEPLKAAGVDVLNATPGSLLDVFPRVSLTEALEAVPA